MSVRRAGAVAIIALLAAAVMLAVRPVRYEVDGLSMAPGLIPGDTVATDWLPLADRTDAFAEATAAAGVVVRPFSGEGVRVTVGEPAANDRWLAVLRDFLGL